MPRRRRNGLMLPFATDRLRIRDFTADDERDLMTLYGEPRITRQLAHGPRTARTARQHLARVIRGKTGRAEAGRIDRDDDAGGADFLPQRPAPLDDCAFRRAVKRYSGDALSS